MRWSRRVASRGRFSPRRSRRARSIPVRPGDRVAADGKIIEGTSAIDEAPVTGESVPKSKGPGDQVFAGTINSDTVLKVRVTAAAADSTIARVVRLVEDAQESKAPTERFIDRFSRWYTPGVLAAGALVAIVPLLLLDGSWNEWIYKGLAILLIGCPCALVISTPAAIAAGLSAGARRGLLIKGGAIVEAFRNVTMVALDKTGTLTEGKPVVTDVVGLGRPEQKVLSLAAALETGSSRPLALAISAKAKEMKAAVPPAMGAKAMAKGLTVLWAARWSPFSRRKPPDGKCTLDDAVKAQIDTFNAEGKTVSVLLAGGRPAGLIAIRDEPRADAAAGLAVLKDMGIRTLMLTGDNARTAEAIPARTSASRSMQACYPRTSSGSCARGRRRATRRQGRRREWTDAPALAAADIGIAMGGGTDVALETADAAVLHGRVMDIANLVRLSKATMGNIRQNITVALGLKAVFLVTTIVGVTGLWPAILADTGATVLVTANAMRLLAWKGR